MCNLSHVHLFLLTVFIYCIVHVIILCTGHMCLHVQFHALMQAGVFPTSDHI